MFPTVIARRDLGALALAAWLPAAHAAASEALIAMVRFDALYIPVLSLTSAAQADAKAVPKAQAAATRLRAAWPALKAELAARPPSAPAQSAWRQALQQVDRHLARADQAMARQDWKLAHDALEPVRIDLMQVRHAAGFDYFIDRLTAYHEPMETLALAGATLRPDAVDARRRAELEQAYIQAAARWRDIEQHLGEVPAHRLSPARDAQLRKGLADAAVALTRMSDALRGTDPAALLAAARAIKPPFARAFTAFGLADGETLPA